MLIERRLRLLTPLLAAKRSNDPESPRRVFVREVRIPKGEPADLVYIKSDLARWEWAFLEARDQLQLTDVCLGAILPSHWYSTKRTSTYNCKKPRGGGWEVEQFESIPGGQVMTMRFTLSHHLPPNTDGRGRFNRPPDEEEFDNMLSYIGEELGMSEWGHAKKYGRFEVRPNTPDDKQSTDVTASLEG